MKKLVSFVLVLMLMLSASVFTALADGEISVIVNGEKLEMDVPPAVFPVYDESGNYVGDRTMVPIRAISEKLNCDVYWDDATHGVTLYRKNNLYIMWEGKPTAFHLDGIGISKGYTMDVPPTIVNSRTLLPVRAVSEIMGAKVEWIEETNTVDITYELGELEENSGIAETVNIYQALLIQEYDEYAALVNGTIEGVTGKIIMEDGDEIEFELYPQFAPETCAKFIECAKSGFYDNTVFHRVIKDFMIQGGSKTKAGEWKSSESISGEFVMNGYFNLLPHKRGTLSFARGEENDSATQQFFICHQDAAFLDGNYATFGVVTSGMDVVDKIACVETDENDEPITPVIVKQIIIN